MEGENTVQPYISCIKIDGKPILPPLLNEDGRRFMRELRDQAVALETKLKEKKRSQIMEQVKTILDKCVTLDQLNVSKLEPSKYRLVNVPLLRAKVGGNTSLCLPAPDDKPSTAKTFSLPTTPICDSSVEEIHANFRKLKEEEHKDASVSENSALSTDLDHYMINNDEETECYSDSTTPHVMSDDSDSPSLECSTPVKEERIRRLSYTLEGPSPVLLKLLKNKEAALPNNNPCSKLNFSDLEPSKHSNFSPEVEMLIENVPAFKPLSAEQAEMNSNILNKESPAVNLNFQREIKNISNDSNGNVSPPKSGHLIEGFLMQQQKLMNELLEQQAKEQERLANLFKEQEQQLLAQLLQNSPKRIASASSLSSTSSTTRRNLQQSFDNSAPKFTFNSARLSALIRGYLTRRLLATDRVQGIIQTVRDTSQCLRELNQGSLTILPSDVELHRRLLQQLNGAIYQLHDIFFEWDVSERMLVIARDREKRFLPLNHATRPRSRSLSSATIKSIERKLMGRQQQQQDISRPSSASTVPARRTSASSVSSSVTYERKRSPSSVSSASSFSLGSSSQGFKALKPPLPKGKKPWRC